MHRKKLTSDNWRRSFWRYGVLKLSMVTLETASWILVIG